MINKLQLERDLPLGSKKKVKITDYDNENHDDQFSPVQRQIKNRNLMM